MPSPLSFGFVDRGGLAFSLDSTKAYVSDEDTTLVSIVDTTSFTVTGTITVANNPGPMATNPVSGLVYVGLFGDSTIAVIDPATDTVVNTLATGVQPNTLLVSPDGTTIYMSDSSTINVIDTTTGDVTGTFGSLGALGIGPMCLSTDGATFYLAAYNFGISQFQLFVFDTASATLTSTNDTAGAQGVAGMAITPDDTLLWIADDSAEQLFTMDTTTFAITNISTFGSPTGIAMLDANAYVADFNDGTIETYSISSQTIVDTNATSGGSDPGMTVFVSPDGTFVFSIASSQDLVYSTPGVDAVFVNLTGETDFSVDFTPGDFVFLTLVPLTGETDFSVDFDPAELSTGSIVALTGETDISVDFEPADVTDILPLTGEVDISVDMRDANVTFKFVLLTNWEEISVPDPDGGSPTMRKLVFGPNISVDIRSIFSIVPSAPITPTGLTAYVAGDGVTVVLNWNPVGTGITYTLQHSTDDSTWTGLIALYDANNYIDSIPTFDQTWYYRIKARSPYGSSAYSSSVEIITESGPPPHVPPPVVLPKFQIPHVRRVVVTGGVNLPGGMV